MKEQYNIEYVLNLTSRKILWSYLTTPAGLSMWFADDVNINGKSYVFRWNREEQEAEVVSMTPESRVRYRWAEDSSDVYFEFRISKIELTGGFILEIIDFAEQDENDEAVKLWNIQIDSLKRILGI